MNQESTKKELTKFLQKSEWHDDYDKCCILSGPWGVGKSYLLDEIIKDYRDSFIFVQTSLFGTNSALDFKTKLLNNLFTMFSLKNKTIKSLLNSITLSINLGPCGSISFDLSKIENVLLENRFIRKKIESKPIVFVIDDIERKDNKLSIVEVLGAVDEIIKNNNIKVILVTNFDKIKLEKECNEFKEFKEKIATTTYELNDVKDVIAFKLPKHDFLPKNETNLRTIIKYEDYLKYLCKNKVQYSNIINFIVYIAFKVEKQKIDLADEVIKREVYDFAKNDTEQRIVESDKKDIKSSSQHLLFRKYVRYQNLPKDLNASYKEDDLNIVIDYIYKSVRDGNYEALLNIPELKLTTFVDVDRIIESRVNKASLADILASFKKAFQENDVDFDVTAKTFANYLYNNYSTYSSNSKTKKEFDNIRRFFVETMCSKGLDDAKIYLSIQNCFNSMIKDNSSNIWATRLSNDLKKETIVALYNLHFNCLDTFEKNLVTLEMFVERKKDLPSDFFDTFNTSNNKNILNSIEFVYNLCSGSLEQKQWFLMKRLFSIIGMMGAPILTDSYRKKVRKTMGSNAIVDDRLKQLLPFLNCKKI